MPTLDGVGVIENIRKQDALARVIVLTTYDSDSPRSFGRSKLGRRPIS
jgi:DNA-binding response OmpR family regulator